MGCDIHIFLEKKTYKGKWFNVDYFNIIQIGVRLKRLCSIR